MNKKNSNIIKGNVDNHGFCSIMVSVSNSKTSENISNLKAIIDTGAANTFIKKDVLSQLGITDSTGDSFNVSPTNKIVISKKYNVNLLFGNIELLDFEINEFNEERFPCDVLIGINILRNCDFSFYGEKEEFYLRPIEDLDFYKVQESDLF